MPKKTFTVDQTLFRAQAKKLVRQLKLDEVKVVREQAGLLAELLARITPPFRSFPKMKGKGYGTKKDEKVGKLAVASDFNRVIKTMGKLSSWTSEKMRKAIRRGDMAYIQKRLRHMRGSSKHNMDVIKYSEGSRDKLRNARGRVNRGTQPVVMMKSGDVARGRFNAVKNVGVAKASLAIAAQRFGRKKVPKWISAQFPKVKTIVKMPTKSSTTASFTASAKGLEVPIRRRKEAEKFRAVAMVKRLEKLVKADAKKAGFKTR